MRYLPGGALLAGLAASFIAAAGCLSLDTGPGIRIIQSVVALEQALPSEVRAVGGNRTVAVRGQIVGRLPCDVITGRAEQRSARLEVEITLLAENFCGGIAPTTWSFVANIVNVDPGATELEVRYAFVGVDGQAGITLDTIVNVN